MGTGDTYYNRGNRGCIITKRDWGMHYCNIGNGINITTGGTGNALLQHWEQRINITTGGTGDKSYNRGNRECIITTLGTGDKYYNRGIGDG